jgi:hypothetical protein
MTMRKLLLSLVIAGCGGDPATPPDDQEVITTVILTFTPGVGSPIVFEADDPDGDGGDPIVIDPIELVPGPFSLDIAFANRLEDPAEDITEEVADEADQHQVFLTGTAVDGPAADNPGAPLVHAYDDTDSGGLPIGLANTVDASSGSGQLTVTLKHLPPIGNALVKTPTLAEEVAAGGLGAIGGDTDVNVTFPVNVP